jgi:FKBP-type peptidyl-prolyl cis-trans isomerase
MKKIVIAATSCLLAVQVSAQASLKTEKDSVSYALGVDIAHNLMQMNIANEIDATVFGAAMNEVFAGKARMEQADAQRIAQTFFMLKQEEMHKAEMVKYEGNIEKGKTFLAENAKRSEVKTTESGLQYEVVKQGNGAQPQANDIVTLHYEGTLIDGTVFDSSIERGTPATFGVAQVIPGFSEAIQLMNEGSTYIVYIPQELAYGERGAGSIEPYSTLIFRIELLSIGAQNNEPLIEEAQKIEPEQPQSKKDKKNKKDKK